PPELRRRWRLPQILAALEASAGAPARRYAPTILYFADTDREESYGEAMRPFLENSGADFLAPYFAEAGDLVDGPNRAHIPPYLPTGWRWKATVRSRPPALEPGAPLLAPVRREGPPRSRPRRGSPAGPRRRSSSGRWSPICRAKSSTARNVGSAARSTTGSGA